MRGLAVAGTASATAGMLAGCGAATASQLPEKWDYEADVVTIGMGAGGMATAAWAAKEGVSSLIIEKGKSVYESCSSVCAFEYVTAGTSTQKELSIDDSQEKFMEYFRKNSPEGFQKFDMIEAFLPNSAMLYEWLLELGCECAGVKTWPGMEYERLHTLGSAKPTQVMLEQLQKEGVEILYETPGKKLIVKDDRVVGVEAEQAGETIYIKANKGVMLACGGYAANPEMLYAYHGRLASMRRPAGSNNNTGDGFVMAWDLGAATEDAWIDPPPAVAFATAKGTAYGFYHAGGILVNKEGKRFVNESESHNHEADAVAEQADNIAYVISDAVQTGDSIAQITFERNESQGGKSYVADTLEELAEMIGVPADALVETVAKYNADIENGGLDTEFGRDHILLANVKSPLSKIEIGPFTSIGVMAANFPTEMGLTIDPDARVYDVWGEAIPGLYATGLMANIGIKYPPTPRTLPAVAGAMTFGYLGAKHAAAQESWDA